MYTFLRYLLLKLKKWKLGLKFNACFTYTNVRNKWFTDFLVQNWASGVVRAKFPKKEMPTCKIDLQSKELATWL